MLFYSVFLAFEVSKFDLIVLSAGKFSAPSTVATGETLNLHVYVWYSFTTVDQFIQPEKFHHCRPQY